MLCVGGAIFLWWRHRKKLKAKVKKKKTKDELLPVSSFGIGGLQSEIHSFFFSFSKKKIQDFKKCSLFKVLEIISQQCG